MDQMEINIANIVPHRTVFISPPVRNNTNINTETQYDNWQLILYLPVRSIITLTIDNTNERILTEGFYIVGLRNVDNILTVTVYEAFDPLTVGETGPPTGPTIDCNGGFEACLQRIREGPAGNELNVATPFVFGVGFLKCSIACSFSTTI